MTQLVIPGQQIRPYVQNKKVEKQKRGARIGVRSPRLTAPAQTPDHLSFWKGHAPESTRFQHSSEHVPPDIQELMHRVLCWTQYTLAKFEELADRIVD